MWFFTDSESPALQIPIRLGLGKARSSQDLRAAAL